MNKHVPVTAASVNIEGRVLAKALKLMGAVVDRRTTHPILTMVKLSVSGAALSITGTDLDIEVETTLDVIDAHGDWSTCVDGRILARIAALAGPAPLMLSPAKRALGGRTGDEEAYLSVASDIASFDLVSLDADGFPSLNGSREGEIERFGNGSLGELLQKVSWCISTEETRYYLNGVCWQYGPGGRRFVATDGHRMAVCTYARDISPETVSRIVPRKTVKVLQDFAGGQDVAVYGVSSGKLEFVFGTTRLRSKLIEGTYPDYERVIPKEDRIKFSLPVPVRPALAAIDQAMVAAQRDTGRALRIHRNDDGLDRHNKLHREALSGSGAGCLCTGHGRHHRR